MVCTPFQFENAYNRHFIVKEGVVLSAATSSDFKVVKAGDKDTQEVPVNGTVLPLLRQIAGGNPGTGYTAAAMAKDLDDLRVVVVNYGDRVEKWTLAGG